LKAWLLAVALFVSPKALFLAQPPSTDVKLENLTAVPQELRAGDGVLVTGAGCASGNQVRFDLYSPKIQSSAVAVADGAGGFTEIVRIPPGTKVGRAWLRATCIAPNSDQRIMQAVLLVRRPKFLITWTNVFFGAGTALLVAGFGLIVARGSRVERPRRPI
jgi:hypothetical protein